MKFFLLYCLLGVLFVATTQDLSMLKATTLFVGCSILFWTFLVLFGKIKP